MKMRIRFSLSVVTILATLIAVSGSIAGEKKKEKTRTANAKALTLTIPESWKDVPVKQSKFRVAQFKIPAAKKDRRSRQSGRRCPRPRCDEPTLPRWPGGHPPASDRSPDDERQREPRPRCFAAQNLHPPRLWRYASCDVPTRRPDISHAGHSWCVSKMAGQTFRRAAHG